MPKIQEKKKEGSLNYPSSFQNLERTKHPQSAILVILKTLFSPEEFIKVK